MSDARAEIEKWLDFNEVTDPEEREWRIQRVMAEINQEEQALPAGTRQILAAQTILKALGDDGGAPSEPASQVPTMQPIPTYGDHMTMYDFIAKVNNGLFTDYDGTADLATADMVSDIEILPSQLKGRLVDLDPCWTHVVWYNR